MARWKHLSIVVFFVGFGETGTVDSSYTGGAFYLYPHDTPGFFLNWLNLHLIYNIDKSLHPQYMGYNNSFVP